MKAGESYCFPVSWWEKRWCYPVNQCKPHVPIGIMRKTEQPLLPGRGSRGDTAGRIRGDEAGWGSESRASAVTQVRPMGPVWDFEPAARSLGAALDL